MALLEILDEAVISEQAQLQAREIKQKFKATETRQRVKYTKYDSIPIGIDVNTTNGGFPHTKLDVANSTILLSICRSHPE